MVSILSHPTFEQDYFLKLLSDTVSSIGKQEPILASKTCRMAFESIVFSRCEWLSMPKGLLTNKILTIAIRKGTTLTNTGDHAGLFLIPLFSQFSQGCKSLYLLAAHNVIDLLNAHTLESMIHWAQLEVQKESSHDAYWTLIWTMDWIHYRYVSRPKTSLKADFVRRVLAETLNSAKLIGFKHKDACYQYFSDCMIMLGGVLKNSQAEILPIQFFENSLITFEKLSIQASCFLARYVFESLIGTNWTSNLKSGEFSKIIKESSNLYNSKKFKESLDLYKNKIIIELNSLKSLPRDQSMPLPFILPKNPSDYPRYAEWNPNSGFVEKLSLRESNGFGEKPNLRESNDRLIKHNSEKISQTKNFERKFLKSSSENMMKDHDWMRQSGNISNSSVSPSQQPKFNPIDSFENNRPSAELIPPDFSKEIPITSPPKKHDIYTIAPNPFEE